MTTDQTRTWRNQFPEYVSVPDEIQLLVAQGILTDTSWGNDAMPSFEFQGFEPDYRPDRHRSIKPTQYRLWVNYTDDQREVGKGEPRFSLYRDNPEMTINVLTVLLSNDVKDIVKAVTVRFFAEYIGNTLVDGSASCPWPDCESSDTEGIDCHNEVDIDRTIHCNDCGREWTEHYDLTRVSIDEGTRQHEPSEAAVQSGRCNAPARIAEQGRARLGAVIVMALLILLALCAMMAVKASAQVPCTTDTDCMEKNDGAKAKVYYCNAPTKKGTPCKHRVKKAGDHCFQHKTAKKEAL